MKRNWRIITWPIVISVLFVWLGLLGGCANRIPAEISTEDAAQKYYHQQPAIGRLYRYVQAGNLPLVDGELSELKNTYDAIIAEVNNLAENSMGGMVEYHRLKYFVEDVEPVYRDLRNLLEPHFKAVANSPDGLLDEFASDEYFETRDNIELCFKLAKKAIAKAKSDATKADLDELQGVVASLYNNLGPYLEKAVDLAL